jgi:O-antigen/teichoic acid export membrane protein
MRIPRIIRYGLTIQVLVAFAVVLLDFIFADTLAGLINRPSIGLYIRIISVSILFQAVATSANAAFLGLDRTEYSALTNNVMAATKTASSVALVLMGFGIAGASIGFAAGYIVASILALAILFFKLLNFRNKGSDSGFLETLRILFGYGTPLYIGVLVAGVIPLYNQTVLAFFASNFDIGNYSVASNFTVLMTVVPASITSALLPAFSKLDSSSADSVRTFFRRANKYSCILVIPIATLLMLFSRQIIEIVYGTAFEHASFYLLIGCLQFFLVGIGYLTLTSLFNGLGETRTTLRITLTGFLVSMALSPFFARAYGVAGVIIVSLFANCIAMLYGTYCAKRKFEIHFEARTTAKIYLVSAVSIIPPLLLTQLAHLSSFAALVAGSAIYILVYIVLMPVAKIMGLYELRTATQIVQNIQFLGHIAKPVLRFQEKILQMRTRPHPYLTKSRT